MILTQKIQKSIKIGIITACMTMPSLSTQKEGIAYLQETPPGFLRDYNMEPLSHDGLQDLAFPATESPEAVGLPPSFELPHISPVQNQNGLGTCTSFAVTGSVEYYHPGLDLSEADLTVYAERKYGDCLAGLAIGAGVQAAINRGLVEEKYWPYPDYVKQVNALNSGRMSVGKTNVCPQYPYPNEGNNLPKSKLKESKTLYQISRSDLLDEIINLHKRDDVDTEATATLSTPAEDVVNIIKGVLVNRKAPVLVEVPVFKNFGWDTWGSETIITLPKTKELFDWLDRQQTVESSQPGESSPQATGWHALMIIGYDNSKGLKFKNSWGTSWGKGGYGWFLEQYIRQYSSLGIAVF